MPTQYVCQSYFWLGKKLEVCHVANSCSLSALPILNLLSSCSLLTLLEPRVAPQPTWVVTPPYLQAVGYETEESTTTGTGTGTDVTQGTGVTQSVVNSPGTITYEDLPQTGRVHPHEDGTIDVGSGEATSLASRQAGQGVAQNGLGQTSTGHSGGISGASDVGTTGALSNINQEVPKSGVVQPSGEGSANIESASRPGIFATAVGRHFFFMKLSWNVMLGMEELHHQNRSDMALMLTDHSLLT